MRWLPEEVWRPHQGQVPGVHVGLAAEGGDVSQVSDQVFQGPVMVHIIYFYKVRNSRAWVKPGGNSKFGFERLNKYFSLVTFEGIAGKYQDWWK